MEAHATEDRILDLVLGLLSPQEREPLLDHLAGCAQCEMVLRNLVAQQERLRGSYRVREKTEGGVAVEPLAPAQGRDRRGPATHRRSERTGPRSAVPSGESRFKSVLASLFRPWPRTAWVPLAAGCAAGVLILVLMAGPHGGSRNGGNPMVHPLPPLGIEQNSVVRGPSGPLSSAAEGLDAYESGDYPLAVRLLREAHAEGEMETVRRVYLASALAMSGEYPQALFVQKSVENADGLPEPWRSEFRWTSYVTFSRCARKASADSLLRLLAAESGPVGDRAREVLAGKEGGQETMTGRPLKPAYPATPRGPEKAPDVEKTGKAVKP